MKGLYVHIPFCEYICHYCDFVKSVPKNQDVVETYLVALREEINSYRAHFSTIETIYIGGGTPSMLTVQQMKYLFDSLKDINPIEYTIELNPESYTEEKGRLFKEYNINRVSIGVQSFNQNLLAYVNRKHTNQQVYDVVYSLKKFGIERISVDLIYAIPGQTEEDLRADLAHIKALDITHVSCYSLILEEKTYFYHQYLRGNFKPVSEDLEANMFLITQEVLESQGFEHYEISNFAKNKEYSAHNLIYWTLEEYIGVGLGAHGFIDQARTINERAMSKYLQKPLKESLVQTKESLLQDELIFGLRKTKGIHIPTIEEKYQINILKAFPQLKEKEELGLVSLEDDYLKLTKQGLLLGNQVFMIFI